MTFKLNPATFVPIMDSKWKTRSYSAQIWLLNGIYRLEDIYVPKIMRFII